MGSYSAHNIPVELSQILFTACIKLVHNYYKVTHICSNRGRSISLCTRVCVCVNIYIYIYYMLYIYKTFVTSVQRTRKESGEEQQIVTPLNVGVGKIMTT